MSATGPDHAARADQAATSVVHLFGGRLWHLPGTHLARPLASPAAAPAGVSPRRRWARPATWLPRVPGPWHYWWQAQYLDCLVDAGWRRLSSGVGAAAPPLRTADALLRTLWLRNGLRYVNPYYDDMAWLVLASGRLEALHAAIDQVRSRRLRTIHGVLTAQLRSAHTDDHGGGLWWHAVRDFKNVPATAPAAIHFARSGDTDRAQALVDWCYAHLQDPDTGLFFDGLRAVGGETVVERNIYTYNQGTVLGALLALRTPEAQRRAEALVAAVERHLTHPDGRALVTHGPHDQALFTGILARYLALAAVDQALSPAARETAAGCVLATAEAFWARRRDWSGPGARSPLLTFPTKTASPTGPASAGVDAPTAGDGLPAAGGSVELSGQLQAWMTLEAAHLVAASSGSGRIPV